MTLNEIFRKNLKSHRIEAGLSQKRLAVAAGYAPNYLWKVEKGLSNPTLAFVEVMALTLNIPVIVLIGE